MGEPTGDVSNLWRWTNVPIPETHVIGFLAGGTLHLAHPWRLPGNRWLYRGAAGTLLGTGVSICASAVLAASDADFSRPSTLIRSGPYAVSRNPMYVGWTLVYLGVALVTRSAWLAASLPAVVGATHREVLREELRLQRAFGRDYVEYRNRVRRYL
jgi:protein-S-isoprenylcysteine O-methyltransferase Ste14